MHFTGALKLTYIKFISRNLIVKIVHAQAIFHQDLYDKIQYLLHWRQT